MKALIPSKGFEAKGLGTHVVNPGIGCNMDCLYCYVNNGPAKRFREHYIRRGYKPVGRNLLVKPEDEFLTALERDIEAVKTPGIAVLSSATEPFQEELKKVSFEAIKMLLRADWTVRIITKMPSVFEQYYWLLRNAYHKQIIINVSVGFLNDARIEQRADGILYRWYKLKRIHRASIVYPARIAVMACPLLPGQYDKTFKTYEDAGILNWAEEVFCEVVNPRGKAYERTGKYCPDLLKMRNRQALSNECRELIEIAHEYVEPERLRVLTYRSNMTDEDYEAVKDYGGVRWL